jgi:hypothetical protein
MQGKLKKFLVNFTPYRAMRLVPFFIKKKGIQIFHIFAK